MTFAYIAFCKNNSIAVDAIQKADEILLPLMVIAELRAGFAVGRKGEENEVILQRFLISPRASIASPDESTSFVYAQLFRYLRRKGTPVPINDLWIVSITLQNDATLLTFDQHFQSFPQIPRWTTT
ncbi:MAG: type II toxin-antitoxin system VapC family toxin [Verrucomicrobia bacterium]|nr:type II toxin-antitoxin system VapC family toxin [Verrucomicrobiota bacterium]